MLFQHIQYWTQTIKQVYSTDVQQDAFNVLSLFILDRFRNLRYEEVMQMMQFNLLDTCAGQDIWQMGKMEGLKEGKLEGKLEEKLDIAKIMLLEGFSVASVAKFTRLPEQEITDLKREIDKMKH